METENPFTKSKLTKLKVKRKQKKKKKSLRKKADLAHESESSNQTNSNDTKETQAYISQMSPLEKKIYEIAIEELKTSFNIEKSIGFLKWKQEQ